MPGIPSYFGYPDGQLVDGGGTARSMTPQWYRGSDRIPFKVDLIDSGSPPGTSTMFQVLVDIRRQRVDVTRYPKVSLPSSISEAHSTHAYSRCGEMQFMAGHCSLPGYALEILASSNSWESYVRSLYREGHESEGHEMMCKPQIFCPISGRYAYVCNEGHGYNRGIANEHNRIHVHYLLETES